jgi:hypothetical protein
VTDGSGQTEPVPSQLADQLAGVARVLLSPGSVPETLQRIVQLAVASIDGCDASALCGCAGSGPQPYSSPLVAELDEIQSSLGEGPCIDALGGVDSVYVADLSVDLRWPHFAPIAVRSGVRSALAYRLFDETGTLGALQLYARAADAFALLERTQGLIFASLAGMAIAVAADHASQIDRTANLEAALISRELIGQAQGILMERERITGAQAFDQLRRSSQHLNRKLRDVAQELIDTGNVPGDDTQRP